MKVFASCHYNIIEGHIRPKVLDCPREHHPVFYGVAPFQELVESRKEILHLYFRQISKRTHINS